MNVFSGTVYTITNGRNVSRVTLQVSPQTIKNKDWEISDRDMLGTWTRFHDLNTLHIPMSGYWHKRHFPGGIGDVLFLVDQKGVPVLMLNMEGSKDQQGRGVVHFHYGPGQGQKIRGYSDIPAYAFDNLWYGVGFKTGGQLAILGYESAAAWMMSFIGKPSGSLVVDGIRLGPGLGGSAGVVIFLAFNYQSLLNALGSTSGQFDFALSLGKKWSGVLKALPEAFNGLKKLGELGKTATSLQHLTQLGKKMEAIEGFASWAKVLVNFSGMDPNQSGVTVVDIPITDVTAYGLEVTICYTWSTVIQANGIDYAGKNPGGKVPKPGQDRMPRRNVDYY